MPAARNDSQTAEPAIWPASPSKAKMPAPTMPPMPRKEALRTVIALRSTGAPAAAPAGEPLATFEEDKVSLRSGWFGHSISEEPIAARRRMPSAHG